MTGVSDKARKTITWIKKHLFYIISLSVSVSSFMADKRSEDQEDIISCFSVFMPFILWRILLTLIELLHLINAMQRAKKKKMEQYVAVV